MVFEPVRRRAKPPPALRDEEEPEAVEAPEEWEFKRLKAKRYNDSRGQWEYRVVWAPTYIRENGVIVGTHPWNDTWEPAANIPEEARNEFNTLEEVFNPNNSNLDDSEAIDLLHCFNCEKKLNSIDLRGDRGTLIRDGNLCTTCRTYFIRKKTLPAVDKDQFRNKHHEIHGRRADMERRQQRRREEERAPMQERKPPKLFDYDVDRKILSGLSFKATAKATRESSNTMESGTPDSANGRKRRNPIVISESEDESEDSDTPLRKPRKRLRKKRMDPSPSPEPQRNGSVTAESRAKIKQEPGRTQRDANQRGSPAEPQRRSSLTSSSSGTAATIRRPKVKQEPGVTLTRRPTQDSVDHTSPDAPPTQIVQDPLRDVSPPLARIKPEPSSAAPITSEDGNQGVENTTNRHFCNASSPPPPLRKIKKEKISPVIEIPVSRSRVDDVRSSVEPPARKASNLDNSTVNTVSNHSSRQVGLHKAATGPPQTLCARIAAILESENGVVDAASSAADGRSITDMTRAMDAMANRLAGDAPPPPAPAPAPRLPRAPSIASEASARHSTPGSEVVQRGSSTNPSNSSTPNPTRKQKRRPLTGGPGVNLFPTSTTIQSSTPTTYPQPTTTTLNKNVPSPLLSNPRKSQTPTTTTRTTTRKASTPIVAKPAVAVACQWAGCGKTFATKALLKRHMDEHLDDDDGDDEEADGVEEGEI
ncbi:hypothetical protein DFJ77DRAFT_521172 [Powellomyces hirtus]|nr:hypothetical protein DFJ77DRAFT_521172 [Powellomyces hirtus]